MVREVFIMGKKKGNKKLLVGKGSTKELDNYLCRRSKMKHWMVIQILIKSNMGNLSDLAYKDLILATNMSSSIEKVVFSLVCNTKSPEFSKGNCKIAWDRLFNKYSLHTTPPLLKLKRELHNSKLDLVKKDPDEWIFNLEGLWICMVEFKLKVK